MEGNLPMNAVVSAAIAELGLEVKGSNLMQKADACLAALGTRAVAPEPVGGVVHPVVPMGEVVDVESILTANARVREAEMRAERAEAELRARNAEMRARAAEEAQAQMLRARNAEMRARAAEEAQAQMQRSMPPAQSAQAGTPVEWLKGEWERPDLPCDAKCNENCCGPEIYTVSPLGEDGFEFKKRSSRMGTFNCQGGNTFHAQQATISMIMTVHDENNMSMVWKEPTLGTMNFNYLKDEQTHYKSGMAAQTMDRM